MKRGFEILLVFGVLATLASCVGNKKLIYLQDKEAKGNERYFSDETFDFLSESYKLSVGDVLYVNIKKFVVGEEVFNVSGFEQFGRLNQVQHPYILGHRIDADSTISLPLLGKVKAVGKTLDQLRSDIKSQAVKEFPGSEVEVFQMDGMVSVLGEVNLPGRYPIYNERNTLFDVLALARDAKDYADRSQIKVLRVEEGKQKIIHVDLNDIQAVSQNGFQLRNNDVVIVSSLKRRKYATANVQWLVSSISAIVAVASLIVSASR